MHAVAENAPDRAREHYLNALSLSAGPAPLRQRATQALTALGAPATAAAAGGFDAWFKSALATRREARRVAALKSLIDRRLPNLALKSLDGLPYQTASLQGKVLLLNFFASW